MIDIVLKKDKTIRRNKHEDIYEGENKISWINVYLPEAINDIDIKDYNIVLRCYINADNYIPYTLDTTKSINKIDITHEFTDKDRYIDAYLYITRADEVIGKTNTVSFRVNKAKDGSGLTPREQFDERIAELENENEGLEREVAEKDETITQQTERITELNGEVSTLEGTVAEQQATITRQNTTIDELNTRRIPVYIEPDLQSKQVTPSWQSQYIEPDSGKDGLSSVTVNAITAELVPNLEPQNIRKNAVVGGVTGTFDSFPENPVGGIYFYEPDENDNPTKCKIYKWRNTTWGDLLKGNSYVTVEDVTFVDTSITSISSSAFEHCVGLKTVTFDNSVSTIGNQAFRGCLSLIDVTFGNNLTSIGVSAFAETELQTVVIPSGTIASNAFCNCRSLVRVECGDGVVSIGFQCFQYSPVNTLILAEGLKTIGDWAFGRVPLKTVNFPSTLTSVGGSTFAFCTNLENVTLANGFNCNNLNLSASTLYSHDTILSWFNALADRTGETAYTLYIGTKNKNKMTAEEIAIATNKNWNLA